MDSRFECCEKISEFGKWKQNIISCQRCCHVLVNIYNFNRILGIFEFRQPVLVIRDPETIKQVFVKDFDYFEDHRTVMDDKVSRTHFHLDSSQN